MALGDVLTTFTGHGTANVGDLSFSPNGQYVASGDGDGNVLVWEYDTGTILTTFTEHTDNINSVDWSPDGNYIVSGSNDNTVKIWEYNTGTVVNNFTVHTDIVSSVVWSSTGSYIVSASNDGNVLVWEYDTGTILTTFTGNSGAVSSVDISPNEEYIASSDYNSYVKVWERSTGNIITNFTGHIDSVREVVFSPDGKYVASISYGFSAGDNKFIVFEYDTGTTAFNIDMGSNKLESTGWTKDSKSLFVGFTSTNPQLYDLVGNLVYDATTKGDNIYSGDFIPTSNKYLATASGADILIWSVVDTAGYLYFKLSDGMILNTAGAGLDLELDLSDITLSGSSDIIPITFVNETGLTLTNISITAGAEATGTDLTMSKTQSPFDALQSLSYTVTFANLAEETFYIRLDTTSSATTGAGNVTLNISAEESV